jgi:ribonuclease HII
MSAGPHLRFERAAVRRGLKLVAGVDEVGRGPLAGPVAAAAVILDPGHLPRGVDDSKALRARARETVCEDILARAIAVSVAFVEAAEIDRVNIRQATHAAMRRAIAGLAEQPAWALVDGNDLPADLGCAGQTIVKGDAQSLSIAAASIVAKVMRDRLMARMHLHHPAYGFHLHAGYATRAHLEAIATHGPCQIHRMSFSPLRQRELFAGA